MRLTTHKSNRRRKPGNTFRPGFELLEDRRLLSYSYEIVATLGEPTPGPGTGVLVNDFEVGDINNRGDVVFGADVDLDDAEGAEGEGVFIVTAQGEERELSIVGASAPGGGTFDFGILSPQAINDTGDAALSHILAPFSFPLGVNTGLYRYSHNKQVVTAVVVPGVTPAPGGGVFTGVSFGQSMNNRGDILFTGLVPSEFGVHVPSEDYIGLAEGLYLANRRGMISPVAVPGDLVPGGGTLDFAAAGWINERGDVAFVGHVNGEVCSADLPQSIVIGCGSSSVYVKDAATGMIRPIAHVGDPAPGGGTYSGAFFPIINNRGDVLFAGDVTSLSGAPDVGLYFHSNGVTVPIALPGDAMPGGGRLVSASIAGLQHDVNNRGDVVFNALLDSDVDGNGILDNGLYRWSRGELSLIAKSGDELAGVGTLKSLRLLVTEFPPSPEPIPNGGALTNDRGQVAFAALVNDDGEDKGVLLIATPGGIAKPAIADIAVGLQGWGQAVDRAGQIVSTSSIRRGGDADLDGRFNMRDLDAARRTGKYLTGERADWTEGDWNGDGLFDTTDLIFAFQEGRYEADLRATPSNGGGPNFSSAKRTGVNSERVDAVFALDDVDFNWQFEDAAQER